MPTPDDIPSHLGMFPLSPDKRAEIQALQAKTAVLLGIDPAHDGWEPEHIAHAAQSIQDAEDEHFLALLQDMFGSDPQAPK